MGSGWWVRLVVAGGLGVGMVVAGVVWASGGFARYDAGPETQAAPVTLDLGRFRVSVSGPAVVVPVGKPGEKAKTRVRVPVVVELTDRVAESTPLNGQEKLTMSGAVSDDASLTREVTEYDELDYDPVDEFEPWQGPRQLVWEFTFDRAVPRADRIRLDLPTEHKERRIRYGAPADDWVTGGEVRHVSVETAAGKHEDY